MHHLEHVIWIGGGTGAGKTSIATMLAERHGLQTYLYDYHDARDHSERIDPARHPARHAWASMSLDQRWVLTPPPELAAMAIAASKERLAMVIEDLLARPTQVHIVAEGFGFYPDLIAPLLPDEHHAVWLLPTRRFREAALAMRGWSAPEGTSDAKRARANKLERDALLTEHTRATARANGLCVIEIDIDRTLEDVAGEVERQFWPVLRQHDQRRAAPDPVRDTQLRDEIVASFPHFLAACTRGHSVLERVAAEHDLESYRLGLLNFAYLVAGHTLVTEDELRRSSPTGGRSRLGREHWAPLVDSGFARDEGDAWRLTDRALEVLRHLYAQLRAEIERRDAPPALTGRVGETLERMSYLVPLSPRARFIRELWGEREATTLPRVYRGVWELSVLPDMSSHVALWPRGIVLEALHRDFAALIEAVER